MLLALQQCRQQQRQQQHRLRWRLGIVLLLLLVVLTAVGHRLCLEGRWDLPNDS
jgi:ABC-type cobalamin transport system permease subunit